MFYLASQPEHGCFIFYYEEGHIPISSGYGQFEFPTGAPSQDPSLYSTLSKVLAHFARLDITIIDSDSRFYQLIKRHPEYFI